MLKRKGPHSSGPTIEMVRFCMGLAAHTPLLFRRSQRYKSQHRFQIVGIPTEIRTHTNFHTPIRAFHWRKTMKQIYRKAKQLNPILAVIYFIIKIVMVLAAVFEDSY
jgi:hypothetical protein